jgi:hypothetical protein
VRKINTQMMMTGNINQTTTNNVTTKNDKVSKMNIVVTYMDFIVQIPEKKVFEARNSIKIDPKIIDDADVQDEARYRLQSEIMKSGMIEKA